MESTIADCAIPESGGGGVAASPHANVTLQGGNRIERCNAQWGGAIASYTGSHVEMEGSVLSECHAYQCGAFEVWGGGANFWPQTA